ncbi:LysR family transcriptional regulator [Microbacterium sp. NC79]|uniref:LysR family transcriptional regulator n=1 Tax=Microbacterium sp. NC79 TaxID=2851009 RepID=UPI001C2C4244|nr:LysR family transcriptional regulator [Microbacterium sp. NC79]MBV0896140.1 LysR family transcriptional regulator [Microbacterium sp. NC79]
MELRQMRYFLAVLDEGGITRAARELYISQPSLSQAIRTIESQFQTTLFDRVGRELRPTPEGLALAESVRGVLALVDDATERVREVVELETGRLTIAASSTLAIDPLVGLVTEFLARHPKMSVHIEDVGTTAHAVALVRSGVADAGFVEMPVTESSIITGRFATEELKLAGHVRELEGYVNKVPAAALAKIPMGIVSRDEGGHTPSLRKIAGLVGEVRAACADREFLWDLVREGAVATFIPENVARIMLPTTPTYSLDPPVMRDIGVIYRDGTPSPATDAFLSLAFSAARMNSKNA